MSLLKIQINQMGKSNQMGLEIVLVELSFEGTLATLTPLVPLATLALLALLATLATLALSIMATLLLLQDPLVSVSEAQIGAVKRQQKQRLHLKQKFPIKSQKAQNQKWL